MSTTTNTSNTTGPIAAGDVELYVDQRGSGPDVLLIAGLSDPAEAWTFQLDGLADDYRLTAFDNRGAGRSPMATAELDRRRHGRRRSRDPAVRWASAEPTCAGSPAAAAQHRSWRCAIPSWCAASCSSARGPGATPSSGP